MNIGGGEQSLLTLLHNLHGSLFAFQVVCPPHGRFRDAVRRLGIPVSTVSFLGIRNLVALLINSFRLWRISKEQRIDLLHSNSPQTNLPSGLSGRVSRKPVVWHARVLLEKRMVDWDRKFSWLPSAIICNSEAIRKRFQGRRAGESKATVVLNGVDTEAFSPTFLHPGQAKAQLGINSSTCVLGCFDRLDPVKDHETILAAFAATHKNFTRSLLLVVGEAFATPRKRLEHLEGVALDLGISHAVKFLGFQPDIRPLMAACDLVIQASHSEGCSRVVCEAQAMGKPVITTKVGGNPEILDDGQTGFLFPVSDAERLHNLVEQLLKNKPLREKLGSNARQKAEVDLSLDRYLSEVTQLYRRLCNRAAIDPGDVQP
jgi:glycosyltransferase involved in cell wall biosynthesis